MLDSRSKVTCLFYLYLFILCLPTAFEKLSPNGYCSDYVYPSTGTKSGSYDDKSKTAGECMKRCQAKIPGTTAFYLRGTQCGCSTTKSGPCKVTKNSAYVSYEIRTLKLYRLVCVRLRHDSYALQYQQRWLNCAVVIWDEHCCCCETHTHTLTHSQTQTRTHTHSLTHTNLYA